MREVMSSVLLLSVLALGCAESGGERTTSSTDPSGAAGDDGMSGVDGDDGSDGADGADGTAEPGDGDDGDGANEPDAGGMEPVSGDAGMATCTGELTEAELPPYDGAQPTFTREDLKACQSTCQGMGTACFSEANCPGIDAWNECAFANVLACVGSEGGSCRRELEVVDCCVAAADCAEDDVACVQNACRSEIEAFQACQNADAECNANAPVSCFAD